MNNSILSGKRGQAALEFMVTYGWAIMIIMIAVGALTYFGFTNPSNLLPDKCAFGNGLVCQDSRINRTMIQISLYNGLGKTIYGVSVAPDGFAVSVPCTLNPASTTLSPDTPTTITCTFTVAERPSVGQTKKYKMKVTYKKTPTGFTQTSLGEVYGKVQ